uniref:Uncharacterized protein n=1 Tax=Arundo donax TaxID=35708 RepID=A0A0A9EVY8_ARUDO
MLWLQQKGAWLRRHAARRGRCRVVSFPKYPVTTRAVEHSTQSRRPSFAPSLACSPSGTTKAAAALPSPDSSAAQE